MSTTKVRQITIGIQIKRNYGDHEITFAISEYVDVMSGADRREAYNNLLGQLEDQIKVYEAVSLPHVQLPNRSAHSQAGGSNSDTFPLESIIIENKQGKKYVSATGGRWSKFGVPIYKGCATDLDISALDYGVHDFSHLNMTCTIELEGDKAKRVRSIK